MTRRNGLVVALAVVLVCLAPLVSGADELVTKAKALLDAGDAKAAYELLLPQQSARAGDPEYDYILGVAALEIGHNTEAVFALERVLAVRPNSAPARAQIARAYFNLKETETARREFETVKAGEVPPEVRETIDRYLAAIGHIGEGETASVRYFLEFAGGYDSNVNSATADSNVAVPGLGGAVLRLAPGSQEQGDAFFSAATGLAVRNPINRSLALLVGASVYKRVNVNESDFDTAYLDGYVGLAKKIGRSTFSLIGQGNVFVVSDPIYNEPYRNAVGGTAQWTYDLNARNQFTAYFQYAQLTYPEQTPRDVDRYIVGAGYAHAFRGGETTAYLGVYGGTEQAKDPAFDYLANDPIGVRLGGQQRLNDRTYLFANLAAEWRKYNGVDPLFLKERKDQQYSIGAGVHYLLPKEWRLSPQVSYLLNNSNIDINEYDRWQAFVALRRDW